MAGLRAASAGGVRASASGFALDRLPQLTEVPGQRSNDLATGAGLRPQPGLPGGLARRGPKAHEIAVPQREIGSASGRAQVVPGGRAVHRHGAEMAPIPGGDSVALANERGRRRATGLTNRRLAVEIDRASARTDAVGSRQTQQ